jgi:hypothetical protein
LLQNTIGEGWLQNGYTDTGFGRQALDPPAFDRLIGGNCLANRDRTGVRPKEITDVVYTHLTHPHHVG